MKRILITAIVLAAHAAAADPHHVLVLRTEGNIDDATRSKIDTQVLKLAKNLPGNVEAADITLTDATAAVGCTWTDATCKDQVLATMSVDEIVATTATSGPGGEIKLEVKRITKSGAPKIASTMIPGGQSPDAKLNADVGPMFGVTAPPPAAVTKAEPPPVTKTEPVTKAEPPPPPVVQEPPPPDTSTQHMSPNPPPVTTPPPAAQVVATQPEGGSTKLPVYGMVGGGGLIVVSIVLWSAAGSVQTDINNAPTRTPKDFQNLVDLEHKGDAYTTTGNVLFVGGLVLGGVSAYYWWRDRTHGGAHQALLTPTVFDHGAGIAYGGAL